MALSTSTSTLAAGASRTFNLSPGSALTIVAPPNVRATVTETPNTVSASDVGGNASRTHNLQMVQTVTYGPYEMGGTVVVDNAINSGATITWVRSDSIVAESAAGALSLVSGDGTLTIYQDAPSTGYFCHLYAPNQDVCDPYLADISGALNHATLGANLSKAEVWGTAAGFASTLTVNADEVLHLPACNFDFAGGESMLFMWKGKITAPGSAMPFIGNSAGSSSKGICPMRILTDGTCQGYISSGTASFFDITTAIADGTVHTFGLVLDGVAGKYAMWVDGVLTRTLIALTPRDTVNTNQFMVGNTQPSIWGASTSLASGTKALVVLRGRTGLGLPANYDALMKALMANPGKLVSRTEW